MAGLPYDCALHRALDPDGLGAGWGPNEELLSTLAEVTDAGNRMYYEANKKKGARPMRPLRIPRPHERRRRPKRNATGEELARMVGALGGAVVPSKNGDS